LKTRENTLYLLLTVLFLLVAVPNIYAKLYIWSGHYSPVWDDPMNWSTPDDGTCPNTIADTAVFDSLSKGPCELKRDISLQNLECRPGFEYSLDLSFRTLMIAGNADFSMGTLIADDANIIFEGPAKNVQVFKTNPNARFNSITVIGQSTVQIAGEMFECGELTLFSGAWRWSTGQNIISRGMTISDSAGMIFDDNVTVNITSGNADLRGLNNLTLGTGDTLCFSAPADTQVFIPRTGLLFPNIKKMNAGVVLVSGGALKAGALILIDGTWQWGEQGIDTVLLIKKNEKSTMIFDSNTVQLTGGEIGFLGWTSVNAQTMPSGFQRTTQQTQAKRDDLRYGITGQSWFTWLPDTVVIRERNLALELGINLFFPSPALFTTDTVDNLGYTMGILFPIYIQHALCWYSVRAIMHGSAAPWEKGRVYLTGINELLVGKAVYIKKMPFELSPFAGLGFDNGIVISNSSQEGFKGHQVHYFLYASLGAFMRRNATVLRRDLVEGLKISFSSALIPNEDTKVRLSISLVIGY